MEPRTTGAEHSSVIDVSAIVINWNTRDLLAQTLTSLQAYGRSHSLEVIVVDNGSVDDSVEMVRRDWPSVRLLENEENVGFTRANNQAIRVSSGKYLLLINSDALLTPGCLDEMIAQMEREPRVGAVGPRLVYGD